MDQVRDASDALFALPPPRRATPAWRRIVLAALGSLVLHGGVIAFALLLLGRISPSLPLRELTVELAPRPQPAESRSGSGPAAAAAPAPARAAQPAPAAPQRNVPSRTEPAAPTPAVPAPAQTAAVVVAASTQVPVAAGDARSASPLTTSDADQSRVPAIEAHVLDWLARYRSYPRAARRAGIEGVVMVSAVMSRDGSLAERRIATSSGHPVLDRAALELLERASPVPPLPDLPRDVELRLPIVYRLNR